MIFCVTLLMYRASNSYEHSMPRMNTKSNGYFLRRESDDGNIFYVTGFLQ